MSDVYPKLISWFFLAVSELQEEGINAINLPLSPSHYELDPEDTMLGKCLHSQKLLNTNTQVMNQLKEDTGDLWRFSVFQVMVFL